MGVVASVFKGFDLEPDVQLDDSDVQPGGGADRSNEQPQPRDPPTVTNGPIDLERVAELISILPDESVIVLVGAGASVSAGIPDFRTPGTGLYDNLAAYDLPYPEAVFDIEFFRSNPAPFYRLCRELWPGTYSPTPAHRFLRQLHEHRKLKRCFTQNIDSLEAAAGLPREMVVAAHGNFDAAHVVGTGAPVDIDAVKSAIFSGEESVRELCEEAGGLVKPAITFFGEELPARFTQRARADFGDCRLLLIFGTSLAVMPFAGLVRKVAKGTPRLLINRTRVGEHLGLDFDSEHSTDGIFLGDCDAGAERLAELLGWDLSATSDDDAAGELAEKLGAVGLQ
tara:strand:- start:4821 stop:5837 length:1017 start_codon:yes stop_codon:yes gene_type:complete